MTYDLPPLDAAWRARLGDAVDPVLAGVQRYLSAEAACGAMILPPAPDVFRALALTPPDRVRVVILGQDPYPTIGNAHGLSFSVRPGVAVPGSLRNIFKELHADLGLPRPNHGTLESWARQGVLLLNTVLTVAAGQANAHRRQGWEQFTDAVIRTVDRGADSVFILWGKPAQAKAALIDPRRHLILASAHPSGLSAHKGFFGSRPFSRANDFLDAHGRGRIDWSLPELS